MMPFYWAVLFFFFFFFFFLLDPKQTLIFWDEPWKSHFDNICRWKMIL